MSYVTVNGVRLHVQELGAGPPLVFLHGLLVGSLATWYFTAAPALARTHRTLLYDMRGHGRSETPPRGYDTATLAADLEALTRDLPGPLALAGHSYGGLVALRFALAHPERVARLALVEAPLPPLDTFLSLTPEALLRALPAALQEAVGIGGRRAARLLASLERLAGATTLLADVRAEPGLSDEELGRLACPLLALYGAHSGCRSVADRLARVVPGARATILEGGHYLPFEAAGPVTQALAGFFDG